MKIKPNMKFFVIISAVACLILFCFLIFINIPYVSFDMKYDDDNSFYGSNDYYHYGNFETTYNDNYLSYNDSVFYARDFNRTKITKFTPDSKTSFTVPKDACITDNRMFYITDGDLFCEDIETSDKKLIDSDCELFTLNDKAIAYTKGNKIFAKDISNFDNIGIITAENDIYYFNISDNSIYVVEQIYGESDILLPAIDNEKTNTFSDIQEYVFLKYDIKNMRLVNSETKELQSTINNIAICNDVFVFYEPFEQTIYSVDLKENASLPPIQRQHDDIKDITSNNKKVFFISEKTESAIIRKTVDCETNGLWELNIEDGTINQLSEQCDFDYILATQNYVYCYKTEYFLPRGVANSWVKGFSIEQIHIE